MFFATTLLYPCLLVVLSLGAGLLVDRLAAGALASALLLPVGAAALVAVSQLATYAYPLAPATPYLLLAVALAGLALGRVRARRLLDGLRARAWVALASLLAYLIALAPVLAAARPSFSSFMALSDSAVHLIGADYLIPHGQHYAHLDLRNSYGQFIGDYYDTSYPSGADTLFGGTRAAHRPAADLGLPALQRVHARRRGRSRVGARATHASARRARRGSGARGRAPGARVRLRAVRLGQGDRGGADDPHAGRAGGVRARLARRLAAARDAVCAGARGGRVGARCRVRRVGARGLDRARGAAARRAARRRGSRSEARRVSWASARSSWLFAALPTWTHISASVKVAQSVAATSNPGNLHSPLRAIQVFGVWLSGSYKLAPGGAALTATHVLVALSALAALLGVLQLAAPPRARARSRGSL